MYQALKNHFKNQPEEDEPNIDDETILEIAQSIDAADIYTEVFRLYQAEFNYDVNLAVKKMEHVFIHQDPIDEEFVGYIECLTEAHN